MNLGDHALDKFIETATGFAPVTGKGNAEARAEQHRRFRAALATLPIQLPADVVETVRKYRALPSPEQLAAGNLAHLNLAAAIGERVIGLISDEPAGVPATPPAAVKPIDDEAVDVDEEDPELAAEAILGLIDTCALSGSGVGKSQSREFWQAIQGGLRTRLQALGD